MTLQRSIVGVFGLSLVQLLLVNATRAQQQSIPGGSTADQLTAAVVRGDAGVNPAGDLQLTLPLLTIPGRNGLDFPVYLTYQSNIRVGQNATWVGLGFNVQIGSVSRSLQFRADEQDEYMFGENGGTFYTDRNECYGHGTGAFRSNTGDPLDTYMLNMQGGSYPLEMVNEGGTFHCYTSRWDGWRVGFNLYGEYYTADSFPMSGFIPDFQVINGDGTRYRYLHQSSLRIHSASAPIIEFKYPVSWELTEVLSSDYKDIGPAGLDVLDRGAWVKISYNNYAHSNYGQTPLDYADKELVSQGLSYYGRADSPPPGSRSANLSYDYSCVAEIETPSHRAVFYSSQRSDYQAHDGRSPYKLDKIELFSKHDPTTVQRRVIFGYATVNSNLNGSWEPDEKLKDNCLTLTSIQTSGLPKLSFAYASNPQKPANVEESYYFEPSAWNVSDITLPSGGVVHYEYEANTYNWFYTTSDVIYYPEQRAVIPYKTYYRAVPIEDNSGRIKKITLDDKINTASEWTFQYGEGVKSNSSGSHLRPYSLQSLSDLIGYIGYRSISTTLPGGAGITIRRFTNGSDPNYVEYTPGQSSPAPSLVDGESHPDIYWAGTRYWETNFAARGLLLEEQQQGAEGIIEDSSTEYAFVERIRWEEPPYSPPPNCNALVPVVGWNWFVHKSIWPRRDQLQTMRDGVERSASYVYDVDNGLPRTITLAHADGLNVIESFTYAHDSNLLMKSRNMVNQVSMLVKYGGSVAPTNAKSAAKTDWISQVAGAYPRKTYRWRESSTTVSFAGASDPDFILTQDRHFDNFGNIAISIDANNVRSRVAYANNNSYPILTVRNCPDTLFADDFEGTDDGGRNVSWQLTGSSVSQGWLNTFGSSYAANHGATFTNFQADTFVGCQGVATSWMGFHFATTTDDLLNANGYSVRYTVNGTIQLFRGSSAIATVQSGIPLPQPGVPLIRLSINVTGNRLVVTVEGQQILNYIKPDGSFPLGFVNLCTGNAGDGSLAVFDDYRVYSNGGLAVSNSQLQLNSGSVGNEELATGVFDENGVGVITERDLAGRPTKILGGAATGPRAAFSYYALLSSTQYMDSFAPSSPISATRTDYTTTDETDGGIVSRTYMDAMGRVIQGQTNLGSKDLVTHRVLDDFGEEVRAYKTYEVDQGAGAHLFDSQFASHAAAHYPQAGSYPYSQVDRGVDPLRRISRTGAPGAEFQSGGLHARTNEYAANGPSEVPSYSANSLYKNIQIDENGVPTHDFYDTRGLLIRSVQDPLGQNLAVRLTYDALGNLTQSTDPRGLSTNYVYNTLSQNISKTTPDAGATKMFFDKVGNPRLIQDADHASTKNNVNIAGTFDGGNVVGSFTLTQPGPVTITASIVDVGDSASVTVNATNGTPLFSVTAGGSIGGLVATKTVDLPKGGYSFVGEFGGGGAASYSIVSTSGYECVYKNYDSLNRLIEVGEFRQTSSAASFTQANADLISFPASSRKICRTLSYDIPTSDPILLTQRNLRGRVSRAQSYQNGTLTHTMYYSYDRFGRIEWIMSADAVGTKRRIEYVYNATGRTVEKHVRDSAQGRDYHTFYVYDSVGRMSQVFTSVGTDYSGVNRTLEAEYTYYGNDKLKRLRLGSAQGMDFRYNSRDWLTSLNDPDLDPALDPGGDGGVSGLPADVFGLSEGYNDITDVGLAQMVTPSWDGRPTWVTYSIGTLKFDGGGGTIPRSRIGFSYTYDAIGRLLKSDFGFYAATLLDPTPLWRTSPAYDEINFTYDGSGNITGVDRHNSSGTLIDDLTYSYSGSNNKLSRVDDAVASGTSALDLDDQAPNNYLYSGRGSVRQDLAAGIQFVVYDIFSLPTDVYMADGRKIEYSYDANGQRISKLVSGLPLVSYMRSAGGALEGVFVAPGTSPVYIVRGVSEVGELRLSGTWSRFYYIRDERGTVRVTVSAAGAVVGYDDFYAFGGSLDLRSSGAGTSGATLRFGGKERDPETSHDYFGTRYYNSQIGRFMVVDDWAHKLPGWSPYHYSLNSPLRFIDINGLTPYPITIRSFHPDATFAKGFAGDGPRGYATSTSEDTWARVHQKILFDTDIGPWKVTAWSSMTFHMLVPAYVRVSEPRAEFLYNFPGQDTFSFMTHHAGRDPLFTIGPISLAPAVDVFSAFVIHSNKSDNTLSITLRQTGDTFPATETFITDPAGNSVFIGVAGLEGNAYTSLWGDHVDRLITEGQLIIQTDAHGIFTAVQFHGKYYSISEWNTRFTSRDPRHRDGE